VKESLLKFIKALAVVTLVLTGVALMILNWQPDLLPGILLVGIILFIALATLLVHLILLKVSQGRPQKFIRVFMLATMGKLVTYLVFILAMAYYFRPYAAALLVGFLIAYLCYTLLEVIFLRRHLDGQRS